MRLARGLFATSFLVIAACGGGGGNSGDDTGDDDVDAGDDPPAPEYGFQIVTPDITIEAGDEITYCFYTTIDLDVPSVGVKKWSSTMTPGSHHLILYATDDGPADGTVTTDCGGAGLPLWTYSAATPEWENAMPDGVGMTVEDGQRFYVEMHYFNTNPSESIDAHVVINAEAYEPGTDYEPAAAFVTYNTEISLPPSSEGGEGSAGGTCTVPAGANFFTLSTHAHRRAVYTAVHDGDELIFESEDWAHPGATDWRAAPHFQFETGSLTYSCDYVNDLDQPVGEGSSAEFNEMCMAVGYFFPAPNGPRFCLNSISL